MHLNEFLKQGYTDRDDQEFPSLGIQAYFGTI